MNTTEILSFVKKLVDIANKNVLVMKGGGIEEVRKLLAANDIVFGLWKDQSAAGGVNFLALKGQALFRDVVSDAAARNVMMTAISCRSEEEAIVLKEVAGEVDD